MYFLSGRPCSSNLREGRGKKRWMYGEIMRGGSKEGRKEKQGYSVGKRRENEMLKLKWWRKKRTAILNVGEN